MITAVDVKAILDLCGLKNLKQDAKGWRASTIYETEKVGDLSLSIFSDSGGWQCFRSNKTGGIIQLYADCMGKQFLQAKADLRTRGYIPKTYTEIRRNEPTKEEKDKEVEVEKNSEILKQIRFDMDWKGCAAWRKIPITNFQQSAELNYFGYIDSYPKLGSCYAFICNTPPIDGWPVETKGLMLRSTLVDIDKADRWRTPLTYPIWAPVWNKTATHIILTEGQWDALAMMALINLYPNAEDWSDYQVLALCGGKKIEKYPEIMEYFTGKNVLFIPDNDQDEKGKNAGEKILADTAIKLEQVVKTQKLCRVLGGYGDLNEWFQSGKITEDQFDMWFVAGRDPFRVSNGYVIDSSFRSKHNLKIESIVEVGDDGDPVEIYTGKNKAQNHLDTEYLMSIIKPFPIIHEYVSDCLENIESPAIYHIQSWFAYQAGVAGRRFRVESGSTNCLYPNMFTLLVGPSGIGKSEAMKMLTSTVTKINRKLFTSEDFSAEALIDEFKECPQRMLVCEEFSPWMQSREGSYRFWAMKHFLKMHGCESYNSDHPYVMNFRKTSKIEIEEPCFSILSACTTEQLGSVNSQLLTDGTVGRFFYPIASEKYSSIPHTKRISQGVLDKVERFFRAIHGTPIRTNVAMSMSAAANSLYMAAHERHERMMKRRDPQKNKSTYTSRWNIHFRKFAILFELCRTIHEIFEDKVRREISFKRSDMIISEESAAAALKWVEVMNASFDEGFMGQFESTTSDTPTSRLYSKIIYYMKMNSRPDGNGVARRDLSRWSKEPNKVLDPIIESMIENNVIFGRQLKLSGARKPTQFYLLAEEKTTNVRSLQDATMPENSRTHKFNGQSNHTNGSSKIETRGLAERIEEI